MVLIYRETYECDCGAVLTEKQRHSHEIREQHQEHLKTLPDYTPWKPQVIIPYQCRCGSILKSTGLRNAIQKHEKTQIHQLHISINPSPYLEV